MNRVIGILAHVDAGKTTFSEQVLFHTGAIRAAGRVDHKNAFMDAHPLEKQRGITIFSDQAVFEMNGDRYFWVDTPGHSDFSTEMERAVTIMDYAVLIINGAEGIQSHTETVWGLLKTYKVPVFIFINKTDRTGCDPVKVIDELKCRLSPDITDMHGWHGGDMPEALVESAAERDEALLDRLMEDDFDAGTWTDALRNQIASRQIFPAYSGSALMDKGIGEFLEALALLTHGKENTSAPFSGLVYKVRRDAQGNRLCFFKVLSGTVSPRDEIRLPDGSAKINELRLYHGAKHMPLAQGETSMLCAAAGLSSVRPGDYIGQAAGRKNAFLSEPMMAVSVIWDKSVPNGKILAALREMEDEDPTLSVMVNEGTGSIDLHVMGAIQLEVIRQLMLDRYGYNIDFGPMRVLYMETITAPSLGIGHYEPLRHYAEVQLRLVPGNRGSGITFKSSCHVDTLALNWQRLIQTHVFEKTHKGVLTGAPLTDVCVELLSGRSHLKHTEGGDFRQSTYRAIRNALMYAESVLLEPICRFTLRAPEDCYGRVMGDLTRMYAKLDPPVMEGESFTLSGEAAFSLFSGYLTDFMAASHGRGVMNYRLDHYEPCRDAETVIAQAGYNPLADDTPDSVFCAKGAGYTVPWDEVRAHAHCPLPDDIL
ncbi:MAG: TetM/TetW/TetO/TetS family tetracycline resistance ribosomal protection protein [Clostridia bacterium]|nr:TetM/TetW/TetO/TetS family tetracycline resistance ribosomal protection protein [Clostridia bacterium]